jgi:hypothetical protein
MVLQSFIGEKNRSIQRQPTTIQRHPKTVNNPKTTNDHPKTTNNHPLLDAVMFSVGTIAYL